MTMLSILFPVQYNRRVIMKLLYRRVDLHGSLRLNNFLWNWHRMTINFIIMHFSYMFIYDSLCVSRLSVQITFGKLWHNGFHNLTITFCMCGSDMHIFCCCGFQLWSVWWCHKGFLVSNPLKPIFIGTKDEMSCMLFFLRSHLERVWT